MRLNPLFSIRSDLTVVLYRDRHVLSDWQVVVGWTRSLLASVQSTGSLTNRGGLTRRNITEDLYLHCTHYSHWGPCVNMAAGLIGSPASVL
jgi:hypothetical protein